MMSTYINTPKYYGPRAPKPGLWFHIMADTEQELHAFARRLGLRRSWFQGDHYDAYGAKKHERALSLGAELVTPRQLVALRRRNR